MQLHTCQPQSVTSEILASITGLEYEFTKAPRNIRSLVISVFYFVSAISRAIGQAMNPLVADSNLKRTPLSLYIVLSLALPRGSTGIIASAAGVCCRSH